MGKIKAKKHSLKWSFILYLPLCLLLSYAGTFAIGHGTNYIQDWYEDRHPELFSHTEQHYQSVDDEDITYSVIIGRMLVPSENIISALPYGIISFAQVILIPLWVLFCVGITGIIYYNRELKKPIALLLDASGKISENQLDFEIQAPRNNELGMLCNAFEEMRSALYENNREMWRSLEERKRLNSAFSHDLRTPLTVLRGYTDFLLKYVPEDKVSRGKLLDVLSMMNGQIIRLEHYTRKMNTVQKLEDIVPRAEEIPVDKLMEQLRETGKLICSKKQFHMDFSADCSTVFADPELVMQVYENLMANACRYAKNMVSMQCNISENMLKITVQDDGNGFTETALQNALEPFFRDEKEPDKTHFGLGLYICRILCAKCGGNLTISNYNNGGSAEAEFFCGKISESR